VGQGTELLVEHQRRHRPGGEVEGAVAADVELGGQRRAGADPGLGQGRVALGVGEERGGPELVGIAHHHRPPGPQQGGGGRRLVHACGPVEDHQVE
jgi:hypothetical protein